MPWTDTDTAQVDSKMDQLNNEYQRRAESIDQIRILRQKLEMLKSDPRDIDGTELTPERRLTLKTALIAQADALLAP